MQVVYPASIREQARRMGVNLPESELVEALPAVVDMGAEFGADFGFINIKAAVKRASGAVKKNVLRPASSGTGSGIVNGNAVAFAIKSPVMPASMAMAAADRLLGDPKIGNAAAIIRNTTALAALGDPAAKRGLVALQAVGNIRAATGAGAGKAVITAKAPAARNVTIARTPAQVRRMAAKQTEVRKRPGLWRRIMIKLGFSKS